MLKATPNPKAAITNQPELLKATNPQQELNFGFLGWYRDAETNTFYNNQRDAVSAVLGWYYQFDPIGQAGGPNGYIYAAADPLRFTDPRGLNPVAGGMIGAEVGTAIFPGVGTVVGGVVGVGVGAIIGWNVIGPMLAKPPESADDRNGPKAPGKPGEAEGFKDPKGGEDWVRNPKMVAATAGRAQMVAFGVQPGRTLARQAMPMVGRTGM